MSRIVFPPSDNSVTRKRNFSFTRTITGSFSPPAGKGFYLLKIVDTPEDNTRDVVISLVSHEPGVFNSCAFLVVDITSANADTEDPLLEESKCCLAIRDKGTSLKVHKAMVYQNISRSDEDRWDIGLN